MRGRSVIDRLSNATTAHRRWGIVVLLLVVLLLAFLLSAFRGDGQLTSPWWPATAVAALAFYLARGLGERTLVLIGVFLFEAIANYIGGTGLAIVLVFSLASVAETAIIGSLLPRPHPPGTFGVRTAVRILLASFLGSALAGLVGGAVAASVGNSDPLLLGYSAFASHWSAAALILPFAFLSAQFYTTRRAAELAGEAVVGLLVVGVMFLPEQRFALTFAIFPVLMWLVLRFPTGIVMAQVGVISAASAVALELSAAFAGVASLTWTPYIQTYWIAITSTCLIFSGLRNDQAETDLQLRARNDLLRGSIVDTHAGFLCLAPSSQYPGRYEVMDSNAQARALLDDHLDDGDVPLHLRESSDLMPVVEAALADTLDHQSSLRAASGNTVAVRSRRVHNARIGDLAIVEVIDVTQRLEDEESWERTLLMERASKRQLKELDRQKEVFIGAVNHELRSPVTNILGHADLLVQEDLPEGGRWRAEVIVRNAERLATLISDVIATTRMAGALPEPVLRPVDLGRLVRDAVEDISPNARALHVAVHVLPTASVGVVTGELDVQQIVENLLGNAVKFATPVSMVHVAVREVEGRAVVEIANLGHPLTREEQSRVFDRFYRTPQAVADATPGSGVGLGIARVLAHRVGADLTLESNETGITVVRLRFPRAT